jgi:hypothetical protein
MSIVFTKEREQERIEGPRRTPRPTDRISEQVSLAIGIMWLVGYVAVGALEPETHHSLPVIAIVLTVLFHLALAAMVVGLVAHRRVARCVRVLPRRHRRLPDDRSPHDGRVVARADGDLAGARRGQRHRAAAE